MKDQTLNDLAVETLSDLKEAHKVASSYNDFGSVLGARDELELIERELRDTLNRVRLRCLVGVAPPHRSSTLCA